MPESGTRMAEGSSEVEDKDWGLLKVGVSKVGQGNLVPSL